MKKLTVIVFAILAMVGCNKKAEQQNLMKYRPLGATGIEVSEIGIGCGAFEKFDTAQAREYMSLAMDSGVNYIDIYDANPTVRTNIGYALRGRRDRMNIQGHIGVIWKDGQYSKTRDVEESRQGFEDLLTRLETDYIEVGMIHITDSWEQWEEIQNSEYLEYVKQLKAEGKIKHIGLSSHNAEVALAAVKSGMVEVLMFSLNPAFDRLPSGVNPWDADFASKSMEGVDPVRIELYDYCTMHNIAIVNMKSFAGGRLLDATKSPLGVALTPVQCLAYVLAKPCVACALTGANTCEELQQALDYVTATDEDKDYSKVLDRHDGQKAEQCNYCGHCAPCKAKIDIAEVNRLLDEYEAQGCEGVSPELQARYDALEHKASECQQCGECMERCPFKVNIVERMAKAAEVFEHK